jgi:hypothetical protein
MSRKIPESSEDWTEEDVLYLHQYDQRADEVKEAAERLGVDLPGPTGVDAPQRAGLAEPGLPCPTCGQTVPEPSVPGEENVASEYDDMTKAELTEELDRRGLDYGSGDTKAELIAALTADDNG